MEFKIKHADKGDVITKTFSKNRVTRSINKCFSHIVLKLPVDKIKRNANVLQIGMYINKISSK